MPKETSGSLHPAVTACAALIHSATELHRYHPSDDNLVAVADAARVAWNIGRSLATEIPGERGTQIKLCMEELYSEAADYVRERRPSAERERSEAQTIEVKLNVFGDNLDELRREVRELKAMLVAGGKERAA